MPLNNYNFDQIPITVAEGKEDSDSCMSEINIYISDDSNMAAESKDGQAKPMVYISCQIQFPPAIHSKMCHYPILVLQYFCY